MDYSDNALETLSQIIPTDKFTLDTIEYFEDSYAYIGKITNIILELCQDVIQNKEQMSAQQKAIVLEILQSHTSQYLAHIAQMVASKEQKKLPQADRPIEINVNYGDADHKTRMLIDEINEEMSQ